MARAGRFRYGDFDSGGRNPFGERPELNKSALRPHFIAAFCATGPEQVGGGPTYFDLKLISKTRSLNYGAKEYGLRPGPRPPPQNTLPASVDSSRLATASSGLGGGPLWSTAPSPRCKLNRPRHLVQRLKVTFYPPAPCGTWGPRPPPSRTEGDPGDRPHMEGIRG